MRILVVGSANSGQKEAVETLLGKKTHVDDWEGAMFEHTFDAKYFKAQAGIWVDQFPPEGAKEWAKQFASDDAKEVRDVLVMVIYTFDRADRGIEQFVDKLQEEAWRGTFVALPSVELDPHSEAIMDKLEMTVVNSDELLDTVHTALFDWIDEDDEEKEDEGPHDEDLEEIKQSLTEPLLPIDELDTIITKLRIARDDQQMSKQEKMKLAEELAEKLVP
ncbi:Uncharacterized protein C19A8.11c [Wickerhamiella sorbophila]|uniref:Increased recombination centers protein 6 n=1 Tax=Wickerhamiella sorbophila TaxID=45607 RepID=A0A2T0FF95_9ASCO|nr:Uncharacterized protein C19A8.11c [Wickerhamiella sorbophila]PRT53637.1 Uncharacterized protein C19A8.11c [Wickerhamiella sorbophila]